MQKQKTELELLHENQLNINKLLSDKNIDLEQKNVKIEQLVVKTTQLMETKEKLFSIVAHDLKSSFNSILGFSELLLENNSSDTELSIEYLNIINSSARNTMDLLDNLLNWAASQTGQLEFRPEKIQLKKISSEVCELLSSNSKVKNIILNDYVSEDILVDADANMLRTILRNLILNAIKFTGLNGQVDIIAFRNNDHVEIIISDNGIGMSEENLAKIFNINYSTHGTSHEKGTGLGLMLCKDFIERHGGHITVQSELNKGSKFTFILPSGIA
jgi:signal transduction histidine kinase